MVTQWFFQTVSEVVGPVSASQLKRLARSGDISSESLVKKGVDGDWVYADRFRGFYEAMKAAKKEEMVE